MMKNKFKKLDIGHSNFRIDQAIAVLETTVSQTSYENNIRVIKIITGHGSGKLKKAVRTWCEEQEGRFRAVISGEDYNIFNKEASDMRSDANIKNDPDFGRDNSAIIYIWLW